MELVAGECQLSQACCRDQVIRPLRQRLVQDPAGLRIVGRVSRFPDSLEVRETERLESLDVVGVRLQLGLQACDLGLGVTGREAALKLLCDRSRKIVAGRRRSAMPECAAEREDGGGKSRRRPCDHEPSSHYEWLGKGVPFVLSKPLNGAGSYGKTCRLGTSFASTPSPSGRL